MSNSEQVPITRRTVDAAWCSLAAQEWVEGHHRWGAADVVDAARTVAWAWAHCRFEEELDGERGPAWALMMQYAEEDLMCPGVRITCSGRVLFAVMALDARDGADDDLFAEMESRWDEIRMRAWYLDAHQDD